MAKMTLTKIACLAILPFVLTSTSIEAATIATDNFESGGLKQIVAEGFKWTDSTKTSVVTTNTPSTAGINLTNKLANDSGINALKFQYPAGQNWSEQRFTLGKAYPDLWVSYWLYIPANFYHRTVKPTNNKLFAIWMDGYSTKGLGPTVVWEAWDNGNGGSDLAVHYSTGNNTAAGPHMMAKPFIDIQKDRDQWLHIVLNVKAATAKGTNDGVIQMYMRRKGESSLTKLHDIRNADISIPTSGPNGWKNGYFMGWSNPSFDQDTYFLIDRVEFSTTPPEPLPPFVANSKPNAPITK